MSARICDSSCMIEAIKGRVGSTLFITQHPNQYQTLLIKYKRVFFRVFMREQVKQGGSKRVGVLTKCFSNVAKRECDNK